MSNSAAKGARPLLNILVAHMPEARPLLELFSLKPLGQSRLPVYSNEQGVTLAVSGNGCAAMTAAVEALADLQGESVAPAWLNVGIAGHGSAAIGRGLLINRICDAQSQAVYFPTPGLHGFAHSALVTVAEVERHYHQDAAYDMEALAFWKAALQHGRLDQIQSYKIVSDNPQHPLENFALTQVKNLFAGVENDLLALYGAMLETAREYCAVHDLPPVYALLMSRYHFTVSQKIQLAKLLRQSQALGATQSVLNMLQTTTGLNLQEHSLQASAELPGYAALPEETNVKVSAGTRASDILKLLSDCIHSTTSAGPG